MKPITNTESYIDSRDVIERIEELTLERGEHNEESDAPVKWGSAFPDEAEELAALIALQDEAEGYTEDWHHGATLIRDSDFMEYAQEFAEDIGAISRDIAWPGNCIDWEEAAQELQQDYCLVDFDGVDYWVR